MPTWAVFQIVERPLDAGDLGQEGFATGTPEHQVILVAVTAELPAIKATGWTFDLSRERGPRSTQDRLAQGFADGLYGALRVDIEAPVVLL